MLKTIVLFTRLFETP